jgi:hypothetical protein
LALSQEDAWSLTPREIAALADVRNKKLDIEAYRWAAHQAAFYNVHFCGKDQAAWIPDDFIGGGNHAKRTVELQMQKREIAMENQRLARVKREQILAGGGSTKIVDGVVHVTGIPDMFRQLAEQHEEQKAAKQAIVKGRTKGSPFGGNNG